MGRDSGKRVMEFRITVRDRYNMALALLAEKHGLRKSKAIAIIFERSDVLRPYLDDVKEDRG